MVTDIFFVLVGMLMGYGFAKMFNPARSKKRQLRELTKRDARAQIERLEKLHAIAHDFNGKQACQRIDNLISRLKANHSFVKSEQMLIDYVHITLLMGGLISTNEEHTHE